ncbi:MAG: hypothetical protein V1721_08600 [Pseudomonadota bacterium]
MNGQELGTYLLFFAKFEYALIRAGFFKEGRKVNNNGSIKIIGSDWNMFADKLPQDFYSKVKAQQEIQEIFKNGGPKVWARLVDAAPQFHHDTQISDAKTLIYACKHIRNNVVHGEKLQTDRNNIQRNQLLLKDAELILKSAMREAPQVNGFDKVENIFHDIPI